MALTWVKVVRSDSGGTGQNVYVDGNYVDAAGVVGTPLRTSTGQNTFETVDADLEPMWAKTIVIDKPASNARSNPVIVTLEPA
jgi:hypothetical protein